MFLVAHGAPAFHRLLKKPTLKGHFIHALGVYFYYLTLMVFHGKQRLCLPLSKPKAECSLSGCCTVSKNQLG